MNANKIKLSNYFDNLINKLDLAVETTIKDYHFDDDLTAQFNNLRDVFLNEIRYVQSYNFRALADFQIKPDEEITNDELFPKFCFFIKLVPKREEQLVACEHLPGEEIGLRLIVTDKYLTQGQIECFQEVFNLVLVYCKFLETNSTSILPNCIPPYLTRFRTHLLFGNKVI
jgi:hypothetical protein